MKEQEKEKKVESDGGEEDKQASKGGATGGHSIWRIHMAVAAIFPAISRGLLDVYLPFSCALALPKRQLCGPHSVDQAEAHVSDAVMIGQKRGPHT